MQQPPPKVSIVIPVFNRQHLVVEALESLRAQTDPAWEALVVDDGSNDGTVENVLALAAVDARIHLLRRQREPKGANACRNLGLSQARGEYVIFLDSDDLLGPACVGDRARFLDERPELDFAVFQGLRFREKPGDLRLIISTCREPRPIQAFVESDSGWNTLNPLWRKAALERAALKWDEQLLGLQDMAFHLDALLAGLQFAYAENAPDCFWREAQGDNISQMVDTMARMESNLRVFTHILERTRDLPDLDFRNPFHLLYSRYSKSARRRQDRLEARYFTLLRQLAARSSLGQWRVGLLLGHLEWMHACRGNAVLHGIVRRLLPEGLAAWLLGPRQPNRHFLVHSLPEGKLA